MQDDFTDVQQSYGRCLQTGRFIDRFYEIFMDSAPEIRLAFDGVDLGKQRRALRRGISNAILYAGGNSVVQGLVEQMGKAHSRLGRAPVEPRLYKYWVDSLIKAVWENDSRMTPQLEKRWRAAMAPVIESFVSNY